MVWFWAIISLALINLAYASVVKRQNDITTLSSAMVNTFAPFTHFASTAYCNPSMTINWTCGSTSLTVSTLNLDRWRTEGRSRQPTAKRTATFNQQQLEAMAPPPNIVRRISSDLTANNNTRGHLSFHRVCRIFSIVRHRHRRASEDGSQQDVCTSSDLPSSAPLIARNARQPPPPDRC